MRRREFIAAVGCAVIGGATVWLRTARAQQAAIPVVGFIHSLSSSYIEHFAPAVRQGFKETGYVEGQNLTVEYRSAEGQYDRIAGLVADLVSRKVDVILACGGSEPAKVAKAATSTIPIVFVSAADPIKAGLVASFNRPGGNVTGISLIGSALEAKRVELLHRLVPGDTRLGGLVNPKYPDAELQVREMQGAADAIKRPIDIVRASTDAELDAAFAALAQKGVAALAVAQDPFFNSRRQQVVTMAARGKLPGIYNQREYAEAGGLASYGTHFADGYRQAGVYVGRVLHGAHPEDLPVMQPTKFEFVINLKTAKAIGAKISDDLLSLADDVIE